MRQAVSWRISNRSPCADEIRIRGWDFGGKGKPLALLHHANGFCGGTWSLLAAHLTANFHVFAIDARGHGDSEAGVVPQDYNWNFFVDDLIGVAHQLIANYHQDCIEFGIGSSFGGIITAAAEAREPGLFGRIALLDPPMHPTAELVERFNLDIDLFDPRKGTLIQQTLKRRVNWHSIDEPRKSWAGKGIFANWSSEAFELYLAECLSLEEDGSAHLKCDPRVEAHIFETTGSLDVLTYAPYVKAAVLYARASAGHVPATYCRQLTGLFPRGEYTELAGGHLLPLEAPKETAERLLQFASP